MLKLSCLSTAVWKREERIRHALAWTTATTSFFCTILIKHIWVGTAGVSFLSSGVSKVLNCFWLPDLSNHSPKGSVQEDLPVLYF